MKLRCLTAVLVGALASALLVAPAAGHHPAKRDSSSLWMLGGESRSVFASALEADPPVEGVGENIEIVANLPLAPENQVPGGANDDDFANNASDIELAGDYAYIGSYTQGMVIANISSCADPSQPQLCKPVVEGVYPCSGGQFDIQLSPNADYAVVAHESSSSLKDCHPSEEGAAIIDVRDKSNPTEIAFISDREGEDGESTGQVVDGAHNTTLDWPNLYIDQYTQTYPQTEVFSLAPQPSTPDASPSNPVELGVIDFTEHGTSGPHDSIPDHRPDGKNLLYAASIQKSDIVDISDPTKPEVLQTIGDPQVGISHGAEPNHDRSLMIVTDEYGGGSGVGACGGGPNPDPGIPLPGQTGQIASVGAVHFYNLDPESGLVPDAGTSKAGIFNIDYSANTPAQINEEAGCTAHVFWQAPDENRMVIAWYGRGTRIVDFTDPAQPVELGHFIPEGADTWSAKPHRGFIFTGDPARGMDVLVYTGEDGNAWPATSGAAEVQRAAVQRTGPGTGKPFTPSDAGGGSGGGGADDADTGARGPRLRISRRARRAGRRSAPVVIRCRQASPCRGAVGLRARVRRKRGPGFRNVVIGRRRLSISRGRRFVRVKLNRRGRRLLARRPALRVRATVGLEPLVGSASTKRIRVRASYRLRAPR